ncbi:uncharacterized protein [Montipora foliosa]|uniref:uncharacterized protein n=1 Tax=Montipora foliosa TaxID=591990 RepID=UPI0035F20AF8
MDGVTGLPIISATAFRMTSLNGVRMARNSPKRDKLVTHLGFQFRPEFRRCTMCLLLAFSEAATGSTRCFPQTQGYHGNSKELDISNCVTEEINKNVIKMKSYFKVPVVLPYCRQYRFILASILLLLCTMLLGIMNSVLAFQGDKRLLKFKLLETAVHVEYHTNTRTTAVCFTLSFHYHYQYNYVLRKRIMASGNTPVRGDGNSFYRAIVLWRDEMNDEKHEKTHRLSSCLIEKNPTVFKPLQFCTNFVRVQSL